MSLMRIDFSMPAGVIYIAKMTEDSQLRLDSRESISEYIYGFISEYQSSNT